MRDGPQNGTVERAEVENVGHCVGIKPSFTPDDPQARQAKPHAAVEQSRMLGADVGGQVCRDLGRSSIEHLPAFADRQRVARRKAHRFLVVGRQNVRIEIESVFESEQSIGEHVTERT